ncbi:MAG: valine--tRNA ligase [Deltaproteobacteria bacterium]|nr:valine--tRNA ligase [Deltaproteobacteria bacterium]
MPREIAKSYSHQEVESRWYERWAEGAHFAPNGTGGPSYSMVIPPPNVTGSLHMGHALNNTLQDVLCRFHRMDGHNVLWVPGTDHAGIATQNVVERQLADEGLGRGDLGREAFIERVWSWREETGGTILRQLRALGVSCDWSRERFTMDEGLSRAVREAFVCLWEDGLLYRAERLINWCPRCKTALADIEVVHEEVDGHLWHVRYPLVGEGELVVATTRPETMLGDTGVAVHPEDARHATIVGRHARLPVVGRDIPVVADAFVDPEFGTGAVKITPGHDFNDFEIGLRNNLELINILDDDAAVRREAFAPADAPAPAWVERYAGLDRYAARERIVRELEEAGLLAQVQPYRHAVGKCYRCHTAIEPYLTPQWFVKIQPLAEPAMDAVRQGRTRILPEGWKNSYFAWMENIKDWCVSRQIWWGHQIPAWYCAGCNPALAADGGGRIAPECLPVVARTAPERCATCGGDRFVQDPDVLDTWFSSALWPFSTLGWPDKTAELAAFYPTAALVTGFDILFFWVARMMMMGLKFMDEVPFRDVYIHALVRDQEGQKMSKSKGNVIDPLIMVNRYGADPFRFTLVAMTAMGRDVKLAEDRIAGYQHFVNKLWNAARFALMNIDDDVLAEPRRTPADLAGTDLDLADRWILSRLRVTVERAREAIRAYRFNDYAHHLYQFTWHEFCDWYIEMSKLRLNGADGSRTTQRVLHTVLQNILLLLHPLMPFVTEELWSAVTAREVSSSRSNDIMVQPYPTAEEFPAAPDTEEEVAFLSGIIRAVRNLRTEMNVPPSKKVRVVLSDSEERLALVRAHEPLLCALARTDSPEYLAQGLRPQRVATAIVETTHVYVPLDAAVDLDEESSRLNRSLEKLETEMGRVRKKLANENFTAKARPDVVEREREKAQEMEEKIEALNRSLERIRELQAQ